MSFNVTTDIVNPEGVATGCELIGRPDTYPEALALAGRYISSVTASRINAATARPWTEPDTWTIEFGDGGFEYVYVREHSYAGL